MDTIDSDSAQNRAEMRCPECWEVGLEPHDAFEQQYDSEHEKLLNATQCPNEDCSTGRVDPQEIDRQLDTGSSSGGLFDFGLSSKSAVGVVAVLAIFGAIVGVPLLAGGSFFGGGAAQDGGVGDFQVESGENGVVVTNGDQYITADGKVTTQPFYYNSQDAAQQSLNQVMLSEGETPQQQQQPETTTASGTTDGTGSSDGSESNSNTDSPTSTTDSGDTSSQSTSSNSESGSSSEATGSSNSGSGGGSTISADGEFDFTDFATETSTPASGDGNTSVRLSGSVLTQASNPIPDATVEITDIDQSTTTNDVGQYSFESVPVGPHTLSAATDEGMTPIRFVVTEAGDVRVVGNDDNALYTTEDGSDVVLNNEISIVETPQYDIELTGTGSELNAPLTYGDSDNAENVTVELDPVSAAVVSSETISTTDGGDSNRVDTTITTSDVTTPQQVRLSSPVTTREMTVSGTGTGKKTIHIPGNLPPEDITLRLLGAEVPVGTFNESVSAGDGEVAVTIPSSSEYDDRSVSVNLSTPSTNGTEYVVGSGNKSGSVSGEREVTFPTSVENISVTLSGRTQTSTQNLSRTGDGQLKLEYDGNKPAKDVELVVEGSTTNNTGTTQRTKTGELPEYQGPPSLPLNISIPDEAVGSDVTLTVENKTRQFTTTDQGVYRADDNPTLSNDDALNLSSRFNQSDLPLKGYNFTAPDQTKERPNITIDGASSFDYLDLFSSGFTPSVSDTINRSAGEQFAGSPVQPIFQVPASVDDRSSYENTPIGTGSNDTRVYKGTRGLESDIAGVVIQPNTTDRLVTPDDSKTIDKSQLPAGEFNVTIDGVVETGQTRNISTYNDRLNHLESYDTVTLVGPDGGEKPEVRITRPDRNQLEKFNEYHGVDSGGIVYQGDTRVTFDSRDGGKYTVNNISTQYPTFLIEELKLDEVDTAVEYRVDGGSWNDVPHDIAGSGGDYIDVSYSDFERPYFSEVDVEIDDLRNGENINSDSRIDLRLDPAYRKQRLVIKENFETNVEKYVFSESTGPIQPGETITTDISVDNIPDPLEVEGEVLEYDDSEDEKVWEYEGERRDYRYELGYRPVLAPNVSVEYSDSIDSDAEYTLSEWDTSTIPNTGGSVVVSKNITIDKSNVDTDGVDLSVTEDNDYTSTPVTWDINNTANTSNTTTVQINSVSGSYSRTITDEGSTGTKIHPIDGLPLGEDVNVDVSGSDGYEAYIFHWGLFRTDNVNFTTVTNVTTSGESNITNTTVFDEPPEFYETEYVQMKQLPNGDSAERYEINSPTSDYVVTGTEIDAEIITDPVLNPEIVVGGETVASHTGSLVEGERFETPINITQTDDLNVRVEDDNDLDPESIQLVYAEQTTSTRGVAYRIDENNDDTFAGGEFHDAATEKTFNIPIPSDNTIRTDASGVLNYTLSYEAATSETNTSNLTVTDTNGSVLINESSLSEGETATNDSLTISGDRTFTASADGSQGYEVLLNLTAVSETQNAGIDVDTDGTVERTTGRLNGSENTTFNITANTTSINISRGDGLPVDFVANYTTNETTSKDTQPDSVELRIDGENRTINTQNGNYPTVDLGVIDGAEHTLVANADGKVNLNTTITATSTAENPSLSIDGEAVASESGDVTEGRKYFITDDQLADGTNNITVSADSGTPRFEFDVGARATAGNGSIVVGTERTTITEAASGDTIPVNGNATFNTTAVTEGDTSVRMLTRDVDGIDTKMTAEIIYNKGAKSTTNPEVSVTTPSNTTRTKTAPDGVLSDGELTNTTTLSIPKSWFEAGSNTITIAAEDGTEVTATLEAEQVESDVDSFD